MHFIYAKICSKFNELISSFPEFNKEAELLFLRAINKRFLIELKMAIKF